MATNARLHTMFHTSLPTSSLDRPYRHRSGKGNGGLPAGPATIWLCAESRAFALDYFTMTEVVTPAPEPEPFPTPAPPAPTPTPAAPSVNKGGAYGGIPATVPGLIEAEGFDTGGQGVGYYDSTDGNKKGVSGTW